MASIELVSDKSDHRLLDVVFIHGLGGDARATWEWVAPKFGPDSKSFWPKDLADELPLTAVWTVGYESTVSAWVGQNMPMIDRANSLLDLLDANDIGSRPVVFITHSLGGLLAKALVRVSHETPEEHDKHLLHRNVRGFVFFATPHTGSSLANVLKCVPGIRATDIASELAYGETHLRDLSQWFTDKAKQLDYKGATYYEAHPTKGVTVVDAVSANPNFGMRPVPFDGDHISICKIPHSGDARFKQVVKFVGKIVETCIPKEVPAQETAVADGVDFEIGVLPCPPEDGKVIEHHPTSRILTYTSRASRESITITPKMLYLDDAAKGLVVDPVEYFWNPFKCQFPSLDVVLVNNSSKTLVLSEAILEVASSKPDFSPVIVIPSNTHEMVLRIKNEGWGKISNAVLRCNLLQTGIKGYMPDPPIDRIEIREPFAHTFKIGDFAESAELNLRDTLKTLGVDIEAIEKAPRRSQQMYALHAMNNGENTIFAKHMGRFPDMETDTAWAAFPDGYVVVAGRLDFDSLDEQGVDKRFSLPIRARVFMFTMRYDQPMPPSYEYSAELEHTGQDYEVPVKMSQTLKSGDADRFTIRLSCTQSAFHDFRIRWRFVGGLTCQSYNIRLRHFVPRTFAVEASARVENSQFAPERSDVRTVTIGDCIERTLLNTIALAQARAQLRPPTE